MFRQSPIIQLIHLIENEVKQVESRDQCRWEIDIGWNREFGVVATIDRVCSCKDGRSRVEGGNDSRFGY